ncbi:uncharacterized protein EDB91DRAFT_1086055 [Suillus paluster]|uniref:uncharacterized protein n=1 Tax=Suillus paluster TaxID=48578 RepID=UPI001B87C058|nr:uncharacterized protein EDB91DRAFT_1086055 [Suillus paluster]KAG1728487.1 hypothetical protein EDB91DRAFT_1086055 [Suillus paluster]
MPTHRQGIYGTAFIVLVPTFRETNKDNRNGDWFVYLFLGMSALCMGYTQFKFTVHRPLLVLSAGRLDSSPNFICHSCAAMVNTHIYIFPTSSISSCIESISFTRSIRHHPQAKLPHSLTVVKPLSTRINHQLAAQRGSLIFRCDGTVLVTCIMSAGRDSAREGQM